MSDQIILATENQVDLIIELAHVIWPPTFSQILSESQIKYMLNQMYDYHHLTQRIRHRNHDFFLLFINDDPQGYFELEYYHPQPHTLKIHKLYLHPDCQGLGYGRKMIDFIIHQATQYQLDRLVLNVNKYNTKASAFYEKMGFIKSRAENIDIGHGFLMEDYVYEKNLY